MTVMTAPSRKVAREALTAFLRANVPAVKSEAIFSYQKGEFGSLSPVIRVMSGGSRREKVTRGPRSFRPFFVVQAWVLRANPSLNWTEEMAEDKMDEVDQQIANAIEIGDCETPDWLGLDIEAASEVVPVIKGSTPYMMQEFIVGVLMRT